MSWRCPVCLNEVEAGTQHICNQAAANSESAVGNVFTVTFSTPEKEVQQLRSALAASDKAREEERESYQSEIRRWYDKLESADERAAVLEEAFAKTLNLPYGERKKVIDAALATPSPASEREESKWYHPDGTFDTLPAEEVKAKRIAASEVLRAARELCKAHDENWPLGKFRRNISALYEAVRKMEGK